MTSTIKVDTISENTSANGVTIDGLTIKDGNIIGDVALAGTTPTFTIGDAGAEDASLIFDGNAQDFYVALDDSADDLVIGLGSTVGTTPIMSFDENKDVFIHDGGLTITTADNTNTLTLKSTDADADEGPILKLHRDSGSPADSDIIGEIRFNADNDAGEDTEYLHFKAQLADASDGSEDGQIYLIAKKDGTDRNRFAVKSDATIFNEDSVDVDFRVESNGNTHMLFVDGGADCVNIGGSTDRGGLLNVEGNGGVVIRVDDNNDALKLQSTDTDANAGPLLTLERSNNSAANDDELGRILFKAQNNANQAVEYVLIRSLIADATDGSEDGQLFIDLMSGGTSRRTLTMTGTATVFNEDSIDRDFRVESNGNTHMLFVDGANDRVFIGGINATLGELGITGEANGNANIDLYQSCGSSVRGKTEIFFTTDSSSDHQSMASIVMEQPSGDQAARKGQMIFNVSDNGAPAQALLIGNNGVVSGNLNDTSDENLKKNITDLGTSTDIIKALKPREFDWKQTSAGSNIAGFIAQEVATVLPDAVVGNDYIASTYYIETDDIPEGYAVGDIKDHGNKGKALNTTAILAHAVKTIQELEARITALEG